MSKTRVKSAKSSPTASEVKLATAIRSTLAGYSAADAETDVEVLCDAAGNPRVVVVHGCNAEESVTLAELVSNALVSDGSKLVEAFVRQRGDPQVVALGSRFDPSQIEKLARCGARPFEIVFSDDDPIETSKQAVEFLRPYTLPDLAQAPRTVEPLADARPDRYNSLPVGVTHKQASRFIAYLAENGVPE